MANPSEHSRQVTRIDRAKDSLPDRLDERRWGGKGWLPLSRLGRVTNAMVCSRCKQKGPLGHAINMVPGGR